ncbi:MAG: type II secretion system protein [Proteobacteria bacterium]|nr:type II secretion system protein [Pseudomonadota bacterium]
MFSRQLRIGTPAPPANAANETTTMSRYLRLPYPLFPTASRASTDAGCRSSRAGFTVIELIVCMGVVAVLCGILLPSLRATRQAAQRVSCASNMRQIGVGVSMYANNNDDRICRSLNAEGGMPKRQELMAVRLLSGVPSGGPDGWDGIGLLVSGNYLDRCDCLYCASHHGEHPQDRYAADYARTSAGGAIYSNYQYAGHVSPRTANGQPGEPITMDVSHTALLLTDGLRTRSDFNHSNGFNRMMTDLSVEFRSDADDSIRRLLPDAPQSPSQETVLKYDALWAQLSQP